MTNEKAIQILENLISINGDIIIGDEGREALEMAIRSLQQEQQEEPDKSLEEAAEEYTSKMLESWRFDSTGCRPPRESFIAGAEWQKEQDMDEWIKDRDGCFWDGVNEGKKAMREQMLEDAFVDNYVVNDGRIELEGDPLPSLDPILLLPYPQFKPGDKVRIVVLKAEEK